MFQYISLNYNEWKMTYGFLLTHTQLLTVRDYVLIGESKNRKYKSDGEIMVEKKMLLYNVR